MDIKIIKDIGLALSPGLSRSFKEDDIVKEGEITQERMDRLIGLDAAVQDKPVQKQAKLKLETKVITPAENKEVVIEPAKAAPAEDAPEPVEEVKQEEPEQVTPKKKVLKKKKST